MTIADPHDVTPEWARRTEAEVPELLGLAIYVCPPEDASAGEVERVACAVSDWSDDDPRFLEGGCRAARRRLADGRVGIGVVRVLECALDCARKTTARPLMAAAGRVPDSRGVRPGSW